MPRPFAAFMMNRSDYVDLRSKHAAEAPTLVVVAESPPQSGEFFYDPESPPDPLFIALMKHLHLWPIGKMEGLDRLRGIRWTMVDATYDPIDGLSQRKKAKIVASCYQFLREDLQGLLGDRVAIPLILRWGCRVPNAGVAAAKRSIQRHQLRSGAVFPEPSLAKAVRRRV